MPIAIDPILQQLRQIRDERSMAANTATRVGNALIAVYDSKAAAKHKHIAQDITDLSDIPPEQFTDLN